MKKLLLLFLGFMFITTSAMAQRPTILFPYIAGNPGTVSTLVNIVTTDATAPVGTSPVLHLTYQYKLASWASKDTCEHYDFTVPTTDKDLLTFDASGYINDGAPMWNDTNNGNQPLYLSPGAAFRAMLIVNIGDTNNPMDTLVGNVTGEAMVLELINGAAWNYRALDDNNTDFGFTSVNPLLSQNESDAVVIYPPSQFNTKFLVAAIDDANATSGILRNTGGDGSSDHGGSDAAVEFGIYMTAGGALGLWDRNEGQHSGGFTPGLTCVGAISLDQFLNTSQLTALNAIGGWGFFTNISTTPAWVTKLEYGSPSWANGMINSARQLGEQ